LLFCTTILDPSASISSNAQESPQITHGELASSSTMLDHLALCCII
jgi:hypothetical protein